jgi:hypothetical protein
MDDEILQFTSDEESTDASSVMFSYETCPEDIKLIVRYCTRVNFEI